MLTASSFCGIAGQVWGHDLAAHDDVAAKKIQPVLEAHNLMVLNCQFMMQNHY